MLLLRSELPFDERGEKIRQWAFFSGLYALRLTMPVKGKMRLRVEEEG